jgi:hypothetical protein
VPRDRSHAAGVAPTQTHEGRDAYTQLRSVGWLRVVCRVRRILDMSCCVEHGARRHGCNHGYHDTDRNARSRDHQEGHIKRPEHARPCNGARDPAADEAASRDGSMAKTGQPTTGELAMPLTER